MRAKIEVVFRFALLLLALAGSVTAASWTEYRIGPLRIVSDAGDNASRSRLTEMEQIRWVLGNMLGEDDAKTIWPVTLVLFGDRKDAEAYKLPSVFIEGGSENLSAAYKDDPVTPAFRSAVARQLIEGNTTGRMPADIEGALADLFSTIQVDATRVHLGAPIAPDALPPERWQAWARVQMLATQKEYSGRFRVYLSNLQQGGDEQLAARNTFGFGADELAKRMDAYVAAGVFESASVFGEALNPRRDFYERRLEDEEVAPVLAALKAQGKTFPPDSARGLLAQGTRESLGKAAALNPHWGEPHALIAEMEPDPALKVDRLKLAVEAEPRKLEYWEALARAQMAAGQLDDANKTWFNAERAAGSQAERDQLRAARQAMQDERVEADLAAARRARDEREADIRRVREMSDARIQAAVEAANRANREVSGPATNQAPVTFEEGFGNQNRVTGLLTRVDCIDEMRRLTIQPATGDPVVLRMPVPPEGGEPPACGIQDPARRIEVTHDAKPDKRLGTIGDILTYEIR